MPRETLNCNGRLLDLSSPKIMGILNITPDSFYDGGQYQNEKKILLQVEKMLDEGLDILDIGGMSSRPGAAIISLEEEQKRVIPHLRQIVKRFPEIIISIDTIRSEIARAAVGEGASIINDISAGKIDTNMYSTVAALKVPYILMHMQGTPQNMQNAPQYENPIIDVIDFFIREIEQLQTLGVIDIILDPGFGFGKTINHNYQILQGLQQFGMLQYPTLVGISRKSMIYKLLKIKPETSLNATTALHIVALQNGAKILRVHDVKEAVQCVQLYEQLNDVIIN